MTQIGIIMTVTNAASAAACVAMAVMIVRSRFARPDVICPFYAYPIAFTLCLLALDYSARLGYVFAKLGLYGVVSSSITTVSLIICVVYVRELLGEVVGMPSSQHVRQTNAALARTITELTEGP